MDRSESELELSAVIMCGGSGTRFWPASRRKKPKQFLRLFDSSSLIQETVARLEGLVSVEQIFLLAGEEHRDLLRRHLPQISAENYILEPEPRNTAPALALAARVLGARSPSMVLAALPADHHISDTKAFRRTLKTAALAAMRKGTIATLGIEPESAETAYGYIKVGKDLEGGVAEVVQFVEKPDLKLAKRYLAGGKHLWNSGMFVLRADTLEAELKEQQPQIWRALWEKIPAPGENGFETGLGEIYPKLPSISIDYGVMENAGGVVCARADFGWNDLGSWNSLRKLWRFDKRGNAANGRYYAIESSGNVISRGAREIALVGVKDMVVVERDDVILVCAKDRCQELRRLIELLESEGRDDLL